MAHLQRRKKWNRIKLINYAQLSERNEIHCTPWIPSNPNRNMVTFRFVESPVSVPQLRRPMPVPWAIVDDDDSQFLRNIFGFINFLSNNTGIARISKVPTIPLRAEKNYREFFISRWKAFEGAARARTHTHPHTNTITVSILRIFITRNWNVTERDFPFIDVCHLLRELFASLCAKY